MAKAKSGNSRKTARSPVEARHAKALYLPMPRAEVDPIILRFRMSLEKMRRGQADRASVNHLAKVVLATRFLTEAGHGLLDLAVLEDAELALGKILATARETQVWTIGQPAINLLTTVINEHDRQLRETRLQAIADASRRLDRYLDKIRPGDAQSPPERDSTDGSG